MNDATFLPRVAVGVSLLAALAAWEYRHRRGRGRLREYAWGIHIGSYADALAGVVVAAARVRRLRWNPSPMRLSHERWTASD